jgi:hypothetical protein
MAAPSERRIVGNSERQTLSWRVSKLGIANENTERVDSHHGHGPGGFPQSGLWEDVVSIPLVGIRGV